MQQLPDFDPGYVSGIVPPLTDFENRGSILFDPGTASTIQLSTTYCKDIRGCGEKEYRSVSSAVTLNYNDECVPRLNGVMSISGLFFNNASRANLDDMADLIFAEGGFNNSANLLCPA